MVRAKRSTGGEARESFARLASVRYHPGSDDRPGLRNDAMTYRLIVPLIAVALAACVQTTQVGHRSADELKASGKAIALMRVGAASPKCNHVGVLLGTREGVAVRRGQHMTVANVRSVADSPVAEVELPAGEHHVVAYSCVGDKGPAVVADKAAEAGLYRTSYARFTLSPGEVVNVGYLSFGAVRHGANAFGRPVRVDVSVTDWPLPDIERFKAKRPELYAAMTTRLMTVSDAPGEVAAKASSDCAKARELKAAGKIAHIPAGC
jgi:hypothetical protein